MKATLAQIKPIHPELIPPTGAEPWGRTLDNKQLYRLVRRRSRAVPNIDKVTGEQRWRKNQMTGEPLYPLNRPEVYDEEFIFFLESQGNGNVSIVKYTPPSEEEMARARRAERLAQVKDAFFDKLLDMGLEPAEMFERLLGAEKPAVAVPAPRVPEFVPAAMETSPSSVTLADFPKPIGGGWWILSSGAKVQGKKEDVEEQEKAAQEARFVAAGTPEE